MLFGGARKGWEGESCLEEKGGLCAVGSPSFLQAPPLFLYRLAVPCDCCWAASCLHQGFGAPWTSKEGQGMSHEGRTPAHPEEVSWYLVMKWLVRYCMLQLWDRSWI